MNFLKRHKADASASTEPAKERYGLFFLHETADADVDIVAVHGLGGHFEDTWTDSDSKQLWLRDFLPSQLKDVGIAARIMSYGYDSTTAFSKSVTDIEDQAKILIDTLSSERESPSEKNRPLIFIAHSLGGIIVKKAMIIAHERSSIYGTVLNSVRALAFFGVPHRGSDLAYWSTFAARLLKTVQLGLGTNKSYVEALRKNSQTFADISQSFTERAEPLKIRTFYETEKLYGCLVVDKDSARLGLPNENAVGVIAADHTTICKFNYKDSQRYRPVWKAIQVLCAKTEENTASTLARKNPESLFIVPFSRDPLFLGRENIIHSVDTKLKSERRVALTGIGGVGKSQIAIEYCYQFRDRQADSDVFWIHASTKERFEQAFKTIARKRQLPGWDDPAAKPLDLVSEWLSGDSTWLMILDNADDKEVFFDQRRTTTSQNPEPQRPTVPLVTYLPQTSRGGSILITSRNKDAAFRLTNSVENLIDVPYMGKEDAVALLCKKLPHDHSSDDERSELLELLEYLPLAITQAASYISVKKQRMTIAKYCEILRRNAEILLDDRGDLRRDPSIPSSVLLTWYISFEQISQENRLAAELLSLMSVLDRQGIPQYLLRDEHANDLDFENFLAPLEEFSLITLEKTGQSFQMHRLVQMAINSWLERHGKLDLWKQNAVKLIAKSLPSWKYQFWKTWEILLPHSEVVLCYVSPGTEIQLLHAEILNRTARYFEERGRYDEAKERCQSALEIRQLLLSEDDLEIVGSLVLLARLERVNGNNGVPDIDKAEAISRRVLDISERVHGQNNKVLTSVQSELALALLETCDDRKIEEAIEILRSVLASREQSLGLEDPFTLEGMNNLALAFRQQHKYDKAEKLYRKTLETRLRIHGENVPGTITTMHNLSWSLVVQKRYKEAQEFAQRALDLRTTVLGKEHPDTLNVMQLLKEVLTRQHLFDEADELCRDLLYRTTTTLGADHSETFVTIVQLKRVLHYRGKHKQAEELFRKAYKTPPERWNVEYWDDFLGVFSNTLAKLGKHDEAAEIRRQRVRSEDAGPSLPEISAT